MTRRSAQTFFFSIGVSLLLNNGKLEVDDVALANLAAAVFLVEG